MEGMTIYGLSVNSLVYMYMLSFNILDYTCTIKNGLANSNMTHLISCKSCTRHDHIWTATKQSDLFCHVVFLQLCNGDGEF